MPSASHYLEGPQEPVREGSPHAPSPPRSAGRPKGAPSIVLNLRLSLALVHQLDRYLVISRPHRPESQSRHDCPPCLSALSGDACAATHGLQAPAGLHASDGAAPPEVS